MPISWLNVYDTNIKNIDEQHRKLVDMINVLETASGKDYEAKSLGELFFKIVDYTKYHFAYEEDLMKSSNYPKLNEHINQHKLFVQKIVEMLESMKKDNTAHVNEKLNLFLLNWLIKHILGYDKEFGNFYKIAAR